MKHNCFSISTVLDFFAQPLKKEKLMEMNVLKALIYLQRNVYRNF